MVLGVSARDGFLTTTIGTSEVRIGRFTYGYDNISILSHQGKDAALEMSAFCSIADSIGILLGCNHRTDRITTYRRFRLI
jgi:hypothetical protein